MKYARVKDLQQMFQISGSTVRRRVRDMQNSPDYSGNIIHDGRLLRIKVKGFERWLLNGRKTEALRAVHREL